ncbi:oligosaccharide flippase family protein [Larkinella sp. GY13]|uniref:oligosaccharide flippase family protein n=1 Tax=Larkinella sp. GY13 TaxID=3453720 RepID=UPI003EE9E8A8
MKKELVLAGIVKKIALSDRDTTPVKLIALTGLSILVTLVINYLLAEQVTPDQYGSWRLFLMIASFSGFFHFGFADGINIQWIFRDRSEWQKSANRDFAYFFIQQTVLYGIVVLVLHSQLVPQIKISLTNSICLANQILLQNSIGLIQSYFNRAQKFYYGAVLTLFGQIGFCLGILFYRAGYLATIDLFLLSNIQLGVVAIPMLYLLFREIKQRPLMDRRDLHFKTFFYAFRKSVGVGLPILLTGLLFLGFQNIDKLLISRYYPATDFGYYAFASALLNVVLTLVVSISNFLMQKMAFNPHSVEIYYDKSVKTISVLFSVLLICIIPLQWIADKLIPNYSNSTLYLAYLAGSIGPYILIQLIQFSMFKILQKQKFFLVMSILVFSLITGVMSLLVINQVPLTTIAFMSALMSYSWYLASDVLLCSIKPEFKSKQTERYLYVVMTAFLYVFIVFADSI